MCLASLCTNMSEYLDFVYPFIEYQDLCEVCPTHALCVDILNPLPASAHTLVYVKYSISLCPFPDDSLLVDINVNLLLAVTRER